MRYGSVCSGIEAASVAWHPLGWKASFVSEIEAFPRAVLNHRWPEIPLHGDFTTIEAGAYDPIRLLVGGTPCQSFSVAGLRGGLADDRGNLALEFLRLAQRLRPEWLVWENVPGVLSSAGGRDFGSILGGLVELGYGFAYRVLDAQFFGVAQRRRRVFVVGHLGDWRRAAAVLFERHSLSGHPAPSRQAGERLTGSLDARADRGLQGQDTGQGKLIELDAGREIANALTAHGGPHGRLDGGQTYIAHALRGEGFDASEDGTGRGTPLVPVLVDTLTSNGDAHSGFRDERGLVPVAFGWQNSASQGDSVSEHISPSLDKSKTPAVAFALRGREGGAMPEMGGDVSNALRTPGGGASVPMVASSAVRRLTPRECERLQGFPDDYTAIPYRGKPASDGPRYKTLGNSMAVPVMSWIGRRIAQVDALEILGSVAA